MTALERQVGVVREAPEPLLRALRVIDPTAELLYLGEGRWVLGHTVNDERVRKVGERALKANKGAANQLEKLRMIGKLRGARLDEARFEIRTKRIFGEARRLSFRPTSEYVFQGEPNGSIVRDQETMEFLYRHLSANETDRLADEEQDARKASAEKELQDEYRAADAWRYAFTRSHAVTRHDDPALQSVRSGFSRVPASAPATHSSRIV